MQLRLCFLPTPDCNPEKIDSDGYAHELSGGWKDAPDEFAGSRLLGRHNVSLIYYPAPGSDYHSCVKAISQDKADFSHHHAVFPIIAENVEQGPVLFQYDFSYLTAYKPHDLSEAPDLMEFLHDFSMPFTSLLIVSLFVITTLACIRKGMSIRGSRKKRRRKWHKFLKDVVWSIISNLVGSFEINLLKRVKLLLLTLTIVIVAYRCYSGMIMKTEPVVRTKPLILDSPEKLAEHGVVFEIERQFEMQLLNQTHDPVLKDIMERRGDEKEDYLKKSWYNPISALNVVTGMMSQKHAPIIPKLMFHDFLMCSLSLLSNTHEFNHYKLLKIDLENLEHPVMGSILNKRMNASIAILVRRAIRTANLEAVVAGSYFILNQKKLGTSQMEMIKDELESCMRDVGKTEFAPTVFQPTVKQFRWLIVTCLLLLYLTTLCWIGDLLFIRAFYKK